MVKTSLLAVSAVLVNANVIADVIYKDPVWAPSVADQLNAYAGASRVNPIIYSELCYHAVGVKEVEQLVLNFGFQFDELPKEALFLALKAYRTYRQRGGTKTAPLPDFS